MLMVVLALAACKQREADRFTATPIVPTPPTASQAAAILPDGRSIADVAAQVTPSVVSVFSEKLAPALSRDAYGLYFDRLRRLPRRRQLSLGSGVIVSSGSARGIILTNSHVVAHADKIRVALNDGRTLDAKLVGTDPKTDVAVLSVDAQNLPAIAVADSSKLRIGDLVLAVGNPYGIGQTVTMGIVSALGRANMGITDYDDFIQTDAAINPGNSGGALVNMAGQLVGLNTAIISQSGGYQGIGFAIPSQMAVQIKDALLQHGKVTRGYLGVAVQDLTDDLARSLELTPRSGVLISDVTPGSPAARAGIQRGDVLTAIDGVKTMDAGQVRNHIALAPAGKHVRLEVRRAGQARSVEVSLGEQPEEAAAAAAVPGTVEGGVFAGVTVRDLDANVRARLRIPSGVTGVIVSAIDPQSLAAIMGLRPGDVILEVNRAATPSTRAFLGATRTSADHAVVLVYRDGVTIYLSMSFGSE
ncbi:MAG: peptidase [Deltaproteobacteria bacterium]|nr:peptidase [Deltaproteobacteria bacterium]